MELGVLAPQAGATGNFMYTISKPEPLGKGFETQEASYSNGILALILEADHH